MHPDKIRIKAISDLEDEILSLKLHLRERAIEYQTFCPHTVVYQGKGNGHRICPRCSLEERGDFPGTATNTDWWHPHHSIRPGKLENHENRLVQLVDDNFFYTQRLKD